MTYAIGVYMDSFEFLWDYETCIRPIWDLLRSYLCIGEPLLGHEPWTITMDIGLWLWT